MTPHHRHQFSLLSDTLRSLFVTIRALLGDAWQKVQRSPFAGQLRRADHKLFGLRGSAGRPSRLTLSAAGAAVVIGGVVAGLMATSAGAVAATGQPGIIGAAAPAQHGAQHASSYGNGWAAAFGFQHAGQASNDAGQAAGHHAAASRSGDHASKASRDHVSTASVRPHSDHGRSGDHVSKQSGQHAAAKRPSGHGSDHAAVKSAGHSSRPAPAQRKAAPAKPKKPFLIYDSVTPSAIPAHRPVATYATGSYAQPASAVAGHHTVLWIDTNGSDPHASVLDVEPGDATPSTAASWAFHRLKENPDALARIYTMRSEWPATQAAIHHLPGWMHAHIRWWIADPTGVPHIVPGSDATQWYWGSHFDISTASPRF
ncbi:MAG TPA: hypothetical protein VGI64_08700 [Streptosporangiaceae bacterium]